MQGVKPVAVQYVQPRETDEASKPYAITVFKGSTVPDCMLRNTHSHRQEAQQNLT
jgi:hypothetical protein